MAKSDAQGMIRSKVNSESSYIILNCFYSHNERIDKVSDHSMMVLELDL
jgi:hypothetical protein